MVDPTASLMARCATTGDTVSIFPSEYTADQSRALDRAIAGTRTILRLSEIEETRGHLTTNQEADKDEAVRAWNDAAAVVPGMSRWGEWGEDGFLPSVRILKAHQDHAKGQAIDESMRSQGHDVEGFMTRMASSGGTSPRPSDEIRSMLAGGERQHDFDFLETDAIRALPYLDGDEIRAISDFGHGTSLYVSDFASRVAMYARTASPWLGLGTVVTSDNGRPLIVPTLTGDVTVYTPGEGTAITPSDPTLGTVTVTPTGFKALTYVNREAFDDEDVNLTNILAASHARAIGLAFGSAATTAVLAGINNGGTATGVGGNGTAVSAFVGYEDLLDLEYGRAAPYRLNGSWVMANSMIKKGRKYKDQNGQYLWPAGDAVAGQPTRFDGGSVWEDPYLAAVASATKSVVYGDLAAALIIKATPIRVELSRDFLFDKDQIAIKSVQRISLAVQDPAAAAFLVSANT